MTQASLAASRCWFWRLDGRVRKTLVASVLLGILLGFLAQNWDLGVLAAFSVWIVVGLTAQVRDLWSTFPAPTFSTSEERWGWRFAIVWRAFVACVIGVSLVVPLLLRWRLFVFDDTDRMLLPPSLDLCRATLMISIIVAIASSPRFPLPSDRWSRVRSLVCVVGTCILCLLIAREHVALPFLVHVTLAGIEMAQPLQFASEELATRDPVRLARLYDVATTGVVVVFTSCCLLRLLCFCWQRSTLWRVCLGILLIASLAVAVGLADQIAFVELPDISPALVADISLPQPHRLVFAGVLVVLMIGVAARRWAEPCRAMPEEDSADWRHNTKYYYHGSRVLLLLLAFYMMVLLAYIVLTELRMFDALSFLRINTLRCWILPGIVAQPETCFTLAIIILAVQSLRWRPEQLSPSGHGTRPALSPGLFLLAWAALLIITISAVPIFGAWGFAAWFHWI